MREAWPPRTSTIITAKKTNMLPYEGTIDWDASLARNRGRARAGCDSAGTKGSANGGPRWIKFAPYLISWKRISRPSAGEPHVSEIKRENRQVNDSATAGSKTVITIEHAGEHVDSSVTIRGWLYNQRESGNSFPHFSRRHRRDPGRRFAEGASRSVRKR